MLIERRGKVVTYDEIKREVWGESGQVLGHTVRETKRARVYLSPAAPSVWKWITSSVSAVGCMPLLCFAARPRMPLCLPTRLR